jgi:LPS sulfotransferase NodH
VEFSRVSDATRAAWAWRRYVTAAGAVPERTVRLRYEQLVSDPAAAAAPVASKLGVEADAVTAAFARAHDTSAGRWRRDLEPEQLADVEREAGAELLALGYELSAEPKPA